MKDPSIFDLSGTRIEKVSYESLNFLKNKACINICFTHASYRFLESIIIKAHIFFGIKKPELYFDPISKDYSFGLHSSCDICKYWLNTYIEGNKNIISKISEILYNGKHPVLLKYIPYIRQIILYSDLVNKDTIKSAIIKRITPLHGNKYISAYIKECKSRQYIINFFKAISRYSWYYLNDYKCTLSRCSLFMNYVNENDIFIIKEIFPKEVFSKISNICSLIKNKNGLNYQMRLNIYKYGKNIYKYPLINNENEKPNNLNNKKEESIINLSEDEEDSFLLNFDNNINKNEIIELKTSLTENKKNKTINSNNEMLNKKRLIEK